MTQAHSQRGNVLFIILIGVALFGALGYVVSEMLRGGGNGDISREKAKLYANEILDYGNSIRQAVQGLLIAGCDEGDISFTNTIVTGYAHTPPAPESCQIFGAQGSGRAWITPAAANWLDSLQSGAAFYGQWHIPSDLCVSGVGTGASGCESDGLDNEDLVLILPYIRQSICEQINEGLGRSGPIPVETDDGWPSAGAKFTGSYADGEILDRDGQMSGCFQGSTGNMPGAETYNFFQVLLPR
ncbi:MAG: hypothetical protein K9G62_01135 [Alphaproteobacteria bacterium]|nr:hypothetical protein [Alphaproteobacteria bacterium]